MANDRIEKQIDLKAPLSRVWRALTDYREFGEWFRVRLEGPFVAGKEARGQITHPGYGHLRMTMVGPRMAPTRVEFTLERSAKGTLLKVTESGFDKIPSDRRLEAFRMNENGWGQQLKNIESYVAEKP